MLIAGKLTTLLYEVIEEAKQPPELNVRVVKQGKMGICDQLNCQKEALDGAKSCKPGRDPNISSKAGKVLSHVPRKNGNPPPGKKQKSNKKNVRKD